MYVCVYVCMYVCVCVYIYQVVSLVNDDTQIVNNARTPRGTCSVDVAVTVECVLSM
jgi:hypothetical protein